VVLRFEDLAIVSGRSQEELDRELRLLIAIELFELKRVSTGHAAAVAGLSRFAFLDALAKPSGAAIDFDRSEAEHEFSDA